MHYPFNKLNIQFNFKKEIKHLMYNGKQELMAELYRWSSDNNGKTPCRDDMKVEDGYPSSYQFENVFGTTKWNEILNEAGIEPNNVFWTREEEQFLYENWNMLSDEELAVELNKKVHGVRYKRVELGLLKQSRKQKWQSWEIDFLNENFFEGEQHMICEVLEHRKWETIRAYATKNLKLKRKHKLYKYRTEDGKRLCKKCNHTFPESQEFFYKDKDGYRTLCINCYNEEQERIARENGVMTRKFIKEKFEMGVSYCGKCGSWKSIYDFRNNYNDLKQLHRWCAECETKYMRIYNLKKSYGVNYEEMYFEENKHLLDSNGVKWDSMDERHITNWLINNQFIFEKGPYYKDVFEGDNSKRRFDWIVWIEGKACLVEYFGMWDTQSEHEIFVKYSEKAKKKIKKMYLNRDEFNFILIFPSDLNHKRLSDIFSQKNILK